MRGTPSRSSRRQDRLCSPGSGAGAFSRFEREGCRGGRDSSLQPAIVGDRLTISFVDFGALSFQFVRDLSPPNRVNRQPSPLNLASWLTPRKRCTFSSDLFSLGPALARPRPINPC